MPSIIVYGIPEDFSKNKLEKLCKNLCGVLEGELRLNTGNVSAFFSSDLMQKGLGEEIIIFVKGFFEKPGRTHAVRQRIANSLVEKVRHHFHNSLIECFIEPFNPENGFASRTP